MKRRSLGFWMCTALVMGNMIGSGVFLLPGARTNEPEKGRATHAVVAGLAFLYAAWAILGAGRDAVYWGALLLLAGIPVFVWLKRHPPALGGG